MTDEDTQDAALATLYEDLAKFMRARYGDDTAQLYGVVLSVSVSGVTCGEKAVQVYNGTTTEQLGLLAMLDHSVQTHVFGAAGE